MLQVLDLRNGALLWSRPIGVFSGTATYDDGRLYVTDADGFTMAIDAASGLTLWSTWVWEEAKPVAYGGKLYSGSEGAVLVHDGATGALVYQDIRGRSLELDPDGRREPDLLRDGVRRRGRVQPLVAQPCRGRARTGTAPRPAATARRRCTPAASSTRTRPRAAAPSERSTTRPRARSCATTRTAHRPRSPATSGWSSRTARWSRATRRRAPRSGASPVTAS